jgi:hypothetical protein
MDDDRRGPMQNAVGLVSNGNPIANADQVAAEDQVIRLWARPDVQATRRKVGFLFSLAYGAEAPAEMRPSFESAMDEYAVNYVFKAAASDAAHPRIVRCFMAAHRWFGRQVPGARMGGDNPDNCYRLTGIEHTGRYRLTVSPCATEPASTTFTLVANYGTSKTIQTLGAENTVRNADGSFHIDIDSAPGDGRANHLRSTPDTKFLFIRDSLADWASETPYALHIDRLNPPTCPPITDDEVASRAIAAMVDDVPLYYWFTRLNTGKPVNTLASPMPSGALGGLVSQAGTQGWFRLADDEAMIVRIDPAGARYTAFSLVDWWYRSIDTETIFSSLTTAQAHLNQDGTFTVIVSAHDPGVQNWVETGFRHEVLAINRWQSLPSSPVREGPKILRARLVPFARIRDEVGDMPLVSVAERATQRSSRRAGYMRRIAV